MSPFQFPGDSLVNEMGSRLLRPLTALVVHGCGGPISLAGKQVSRVSLRDQGLKPVFSHGRVFANTIEQLNGGRAATTTRD
jgi:hypothetical protein